MFLKGVTPAVYSRYPYLYVKSSRGLIKVVHPETFSSDPVVMGQAFYDSEVGPDYSPLRPRETLQKCHFVIAHCHRFQRGKSKDGAYEIISLPAARDWRRTQYKMTSQNKHRQWDSGFLVVDQGYFEPMSLSDTNWRKELRELYDESHSKKRFVVFDKRVELHRVLYAQRVAENVP